MNRKQLPLFTKPPQAGGQLASISTLLIPVVLFNNLLAFPPRYKRYFCRLIPHMRPKELNQRLGFYSCQQKYRTQVQGVPTPLCNDVPGPLDRDKRKVPHPLPLTNIQLSIMPSEIEAVRVPDQRLDFKRLMESHRHVLREPLEAESVRYQVYFRCQRLINNED